MPTTTTMFSVIAALPLVAQATKVLVYTQPGLNGGGLGDCSDESQNLESIVMYSAENSPININGVEKDFSGFTVDNDLATFADPELASKLAASSFFFMVDMEGTPAGFDARSQAIIKDYVAGGGVMLMTGTAGTKDADFLNSVFGWDTTSVGCRTGTTKNVATTAGTAFANGPPSTQCPSATDHLNCGSVPCVPYYGTTTSNSVSMLSHGEGKVIFIGWDYFSSGLVTSKHTRKCTLYSGAAEYHQILQLSLEQAAIEASTEPTTSPTTAPTTSLPTASPTPSPTPSPTDMPTAKPTPSPTPSPTDMPTETPCVPDFDEKAAIDLVYRMYKRNAGGETTFHGDDTETTKLLAGLGLDSKAGSRTLKRLAARTVRALRRSQGWVDEE